uniref:CDI domain-containing protein n=1 Tax=Panagrellus redivivus TaxID=6233 RepID=A0A7E4VDQ7_PANRE
MAATSTAKRCLFGKASAKTTQAYCKRILNEYHDEKKRQWGFDFHTGVPLPSSSTSTFVYTKIANDAVPGFYRASVLDRSSSSVSSYNENSDPAPANASLDSSMECDENLASPKIPARTPKKTQRTLTGLFRARKTSSNPRGVSKKSVQSSSARRTPQASYVASSQ